MCLVVDEKLTAKIDRKKVYVFVKCFDIDYDGDKMFITSPMHTSFKWKPEENVAKGKLDKEEYPDGVVIHGGVFHAYCYNPEDFYKFPWCKVYVEGKNIVAFGMSHDVCFTRCVIKPNDYRKLYQEGIDYRSP